MSGLLKCWASPSARHYNGVKDEATGSALLGLAFGSAVQKGGPRLRLGKVKDGKKGGVPHANYLVCLYFSLLSTAKKDKTSTWAGQACWDKR
jgi:hypothetical protein